jgi:hypothetical protein
MSVGDENVVPVDSAPVKGARLQAGPSSKRYGPRLSASLNSRAASVLSHPTRHHTGHLASIARAIAMAWDILPVSVVNMYYNCRMPLSVGPCKLCSRLHTRDDDDVSIIVLSNLTM